jgi:transcriptional regulator with XRE-family HTH domain
MSENQNASRYLGLNIEKLRGKKNLSQQQLATQAGIPRSTLTNIESGSGNPSLTNLVKISDTLGVSIEELLSRPRTDCVLISSDKITVQSRSGDQVQVYKLLPERIKGIEIDRLEFLAGAVMGGHPHLNGTKEYLTVLQGEVVVHVSGNSYAVKKGDVLAFPGNQPHSYRNPGRTSSIAISVVIPVPASI